MNTIWIIIISGFWITTVLVAWALLYAEGERTNHDRNNTQEACER